jgi:hypothetical protein
MTNKSDNARPTPILNRVLLGEASRHLFSAKRALDQLSADEFLALLVFCKRQQPGFKLLAKADEIKYIAEVISAYAAERSQL